jgi:small subunit ribosomal protein S16
MAVKIRLMRIGKKRQPSYRVVVKEARSPRAGKYIEQVGFYNPLTEPADVRFDEERVKYWLGVGAQPTETVKRLLASSTGIQL